jgi:ABC-type molybdate transport system substrate-binding protein
VSIRCEEVSGITRRRLFSLTIAAAALALAAAPLPGLRRPLLVAIGSELEETMRRLEAPFERRHAGIDLRWQVQGSQDMVNRNLEAGPSRARVLIPANRELLREFRARSEAQGQPDPFGGPPRPIARTLLVAVVWPERADRLFPDGRFSWSRLRAAAAAGQWSALGAPAEWGSFDLRTTDPLRSNSGQLVVALWSRDQPGPDSLATLRRAVYRPARSTDILLREFISAGPNEGDLGLVYESTALLRAEEAERRRPGGYRVLVPDPTVEMVLAAAVLRGEATGRGRDGERLVDFLTGAEGQAILEATGFRDPEGRGGARDGDRVRRLPPPQRAERDELLRRWQQTS